VVEALSESAATIEPETTYSVQWRCPNIDKHGPYPDSLPKPCPDCYSLLVTATRIPYREDVRWREEPIHV
jgi:hypothetical protein